MPKGKTPSDFKNYFVNKNGDICSKRTGKKLKPFNGGTYVTLYQDGKRYDMRVPVAKCKIRDNHKSIRAKAYTRKIEVKKTKNIVIESKECKVKVKKGRVKACSFQKPRVAKKFKTPCQITTVRTSCRKPKKTLISTEAVLGFIVVAIVIFLYVTSR